MKKAFGPSFQRTEGVNERDYRFTAAGDYLPPLAFRSAMEALSRPTV